MTTVQTSQLPTADALRTQAREALRAVGSRAEVGEPGGHGLPASTPITGDVLFTVAETTPELAEAAIAAAARAFSTWRTTPAPARGALGSCQPQPPSWWGPLVRLSPSPARPAPLPAPLAEPPRPVLAPTR